jgi:hypothetical protein
MNRKGFLYYILITLTAQGGVIFGTTHHDWFAFIAYVASIWIVADLVINYQKSL